jgi:hypothetical protein
METVAASRLPSVAPELRSATLSLHCFTPELRFACTGLSFFKTYGLASSRQPDTVGVQGG